MKNDFKIAAFISGRGSNLRSLISNCPSARFVGVIANNPRAAGLDFARQHSIPCFPFERDRYESSAAYKKAIRDCAAELQPDLVVLAGYMQILEPLFINLFSGRIINIHPSLLPAYPGLHTHERALADGVQEHGCTVHLVDTGVDTGPIIAQAIVPVQADDSPDSLAARVLEKEHELYPWVVNEIVGGAITLENNSVQISGAARERGTCKQFILKGDPA